MNNYLNIQSKIWLFGSYAFQGNPKALFLYMLKYFPERQCWWVADNTVQYDILKAYNLPVILNNSKECNKLFNQADVYVVENNRENFPVSMNPGIKILNLWHGVGIKPIELALTAESRLSDSIVKKHIKNSKIYKENMIFLATSKAMKDHFQKQISIDEKNFIFGPYPRNIVYHSGEISTFEKNTIKGKVINDYDKVYLFAPTWRDLEYGYDFLKLLPDLSRVLGILQENNDLLIIKPHPLTVKDSSYQIVKELFVDSHNILFIEDELDIYEIFNKIDVAIIDYSSIYYDLMSAGVDKFIRYIPDYDLHMQKEPLVLDYIEYTDGPIARNFDELCELMQQPILKGKMHDSLYEYFFGYSDAQQLDNMAGCHKEIKEIIAQVDKFKIVPKNLPTLFSFDVFDTLVKRNTLSPISIFNKIQERIKLSQYNFSRYFIDNYVKIRRECEADVRDNFRKTTLERNTTKIEISYHNIFERMQAIFNLSDSEIEFLKAEEIEAEYSAVEPIPEKIEQIKRLLQNNDTVILISDMYLPLENVKGILHRADPILATLPLYLSSEVGHQKSTGLLYKHIFFDIDYKFEKWIHHGDNRHADSTVPQKYGIKTLKHDMDSFIGLEKYLVSEPSNYDQYQVATKMQRYRSSIVKDSKGEYDETRYFGYAYFGSYIVPYLDWVIADALKKNYKKLYFISRDGYYLKAAADIIIANRNLNLKTEIIYASRRTWRLASSEDNLHTEFFSSFGSFAAISTFREVVRASQFPKDQLIALVPELKIYSEKETLNNDDIGVIASLLFSSENYRRELSLIKKDYRELILKYLRQNIDFEEPFAFVEFWGRGYAQDLMTDILIDAAGKEIDNPFYYVRCMRENSGHSIRHRFTNNPINFWFVEPIFATTPYKTVSSYDEINGIVSPRISEELNEFYLPLMSGLESFAFDYSKLEVADRDYLNRKISDLAYKYHRVTPSDQFICNVFARFKDNTGPFQEVVETAPVLEMEDLYTKEFSELSRSIKISLSRSSDEVRTEYMKLAVRKGIKTTLPDLCKNIYPVNGLANYSISPLSQQLIYTFKNCRVFNDVRFSEIDKTDLVIAKDSLLVGENIYSASGVPRIVLSDGYITAHKNHACVISHIVLLDDIYLNEVDADLLRLKHLSGKPLTVHSAFYNNEKINVSTDSGTVVLENLANVLLFSSGTLVNRNELRKLVIRNGKFNEFDHASSFIEQIVDIESIRIGQCGDITISTGFDEVSYIHGEMILADLNIEKYFHEYHNDVLVAKDDIDIYTDLSLATMSSFKLTSSSIINPDDLIWTGNGITVFKTQHGYFPAVKENFLFGFINGMNKVNHMLKYSLISRAEGKFHIKSTPNFRFFDEPVSNASLQTPYVIVHDSITKINGFTNNPDYTNEGKNLSVYSNDDVDINLDLYAITDSGLIEINDSTVFPCDNINHYYTEFLNKKYIAASKVEIFADKECRVTTRTFYFKGDVIKPLSLHWSSFGSPVFKTELGYFLPKRRSITEVGESHSLQFLKDTFIHSTFCLSGNADAFVWDGKLRKKDSILKGTLIKVDDIQLCDGSIMLKTNSGYLIEFNNLLLIKCRDDIDSYYVNIKNKKFMTLRKLRVYKDLNFKEPTGEFYSKGKVFAPTEVLWSGGGTPRFAVPEGYVSTNINYVTPKKFSFHKINAKFRKVLSAEK